MSATLSATTTPVPVPVHTTYIDDLVRALRAIQARATGELTPDVLDGLGLPSVDARSDAAAIATAAVTAFEEKVSCGPQFMVIQEGGTSTERYVHVSSFEEEAEDFRRDCTRDGGYRTSAVIEIPATVAAMGEAVFSLFDDAMAASMDMVHWDDGKREKEEDHDDAEDEG